MKQKAKNEGQRRLVASGHSHGKVAAVVGVGKSTAQRWRNGTVPPEAVQIKLEAFDPYLARWTWRAAPGTEQPTAAVPAPATVAPRAEAPIVPVWPPADAPARERVLAPPPLPPRAPDPPPPAQYEPSDVDLDAPGAARSLVVAQLRRLQADTARLRAMTASDDAIRKAEEAERKASLDLAKLAGELNPTEEARLVKSLKWYALREAILKALEPWPDAITAVRDALTREEA